MALAVPDGLRSLGQRVRNSLTGRERLIVLVTPLLAGLLVCVGVLLWRDQYARFDDQLFEFWLKSRNSHLGARDLASVSPQLLLVAIDEESAQTYGWPFPRDAYEEIVKRLKLIGVTTIGMDLIFSDPGPDQEANKSLANTLLDPAVVLACPLTLANNKVSNELPYKPLVARWTPEDFQTRLGFTAVVGAGAEDVQGVWLRITQESSSFFAWPVMTLAHHLQKSPEEVLTGIRAASHPTWFHSPTSEEVADVEVTALEAWPNIPGQISSLINTVSVKQLLEPSEEELKQLFPPTGNRVLAVLGLTMKGGADVKQTMVGTMSGPEIQACTIINLMLNNFLQPFSQGGEMGLVLLVSLWAGFIGGQLNLRPLIAGMFASAGGLIVLQGSAIAGAGFGQGWLMPVVAPLISLVLSTGVAGAVQTVFVRRAQEDKMLHLLQDICPISDIESMPVGKNLLLGEECHATVAVLDLRHYAGMASSQEVGDISAVGEHIRAWHEIVMIFGGVVVDYDGSLMRVAFGINPASAEKHALAACGAGLALLNEHEQRRSSAANLPAPTMAIASGNLRLSMKAKPSYSKQSGATGIACALLRTLRTQTGVAASEATLEAAGPLVPTQTSPAGKVLARDTEALVKIQADGDWQKRDSNRINAADLKVGDDLGKYKLDKFLGQGGMGRVFRALDPHLQRPVALKVLTGNIDQLQSERFVKEARAVARVTHPGIVNVYDAGLEPAPYMAMEYAPGNDLSHMLKAEAPLKPQRAVAMILQVLDALAVVHEAGIVHRDLKPANVMVDSEGKTKLMDFGLARFMDEETRLTRAGEIWGTPEYMAPEQVDDEFGQVDSISDLFAVGTILYECLTARLPVRSGTVSTVIYDLVFRQAEPPENLNPDVSPELSEIVLHSLEKEKADRYQTAREFAAALRGIRLEDG